MRHATDNAPPERPEPGLLGAGLCVAALVLIGVGAFVVLMLRAGG
jgi:hypothetical protein